MKIKEKKIHFLAWVVTASLAWADPTTGWRQTAAGSYDYNDSANWVGGEINGVFGADLTLDGAQTITFAADTTLADGLSFAHTGAAITFAAANAAVPHSLTLGGGIVNGSAETVTFADSLAIDLGGDSRDMNAAAGDIIIQGVISNGGLVYRGENALKLDGANTFADGLDIFASGALTPRNNYALGTGTITFEGGNKLVNESLNPLTIETGNPYMFKGDVWITGNQESGRSIDFGSGEITITQPFTMTFGGGSPNGKDKGTYTFHGQIAEGSPCQIDAITKAAWRVGNDLQSKLVTYANLTLDGESHLVNTSDPGNGAWQFYGVVSGNGTLKTTGRIDFYAENTFTGTLSIESDTLYVVKKGFLTNAKILIKEGATFRQGSSSGMGYSLEALLSANRIDPASAGCFALQYNHSGTIDLRGCPLLSIGSANSSASLSGTISAPETGTIRLGGGGQILKVASVLPAGCDLAVSGNSIQLTTDQPDFNGTVTLSSGLKLILSTGVSLPQATLIANNNETIQFGMENGGDAVRAKEVVLATGTLQLDGSTTASAVHRVGTVRLMLDEAGDSSQFKMAGGDADHPLVFHIGEILQADGKPAMLNLAASSLGVSEKVFVGSGPVHPAASTIVPWIRNNARLVKVAAAGELLKLGTDEVTSDADAAVAGGNVLLTGDESLTVSAENGSIGSISMVYANSKDPSFTATAGTYNLLSAALDLTAYKTGSCDVNLDFGTETGYVTAKVSGQNSAAVKLGGKLSGTGGLVFSSCLTSADTKPVEINCPGSDYTGDTYILTRVDPKHYDLFPHGDERPGNLYVYGNLSLNPFSSPLAINGLNGRGKVSKRSTTGGTCRMSVGCDGSDGNFEGSFINSTNTDFGMTKEGAGRQRFNCAMAFKLSAMVNGGTLQIDGSLATGNSTSDVTVNSGATLSGCGTISAARSNHICANGTLAPGSEEIPNRAMTMTSTLKMDDGSKMRFHVGKDRWTQLVCEAPVTGAGSVVAVTVTGEGKGEWKLLEAPSLEPVFVKAEGVTGRLYVVAATESESGNEELWYKRMAGLAVVIR